MPEVVKRKLSAGDPESVFEETFANPRRLMFDAFIPIHANSRSGRDRLANVH